MPVQQIFGLAVILAGLCAVLSYPTLQDEDIYYNQPGYLDMNAHNIMDLPDFTDSYVYPGPYQESYVSKRGGLALKRASLNQLLQRLISLYGSNEIPFTGRSAHMRFGAGGR